MSESYTCIECENLYDDTDGDTDERLCDKCGCQIYEEPTTADEYNKEWLDDDVHMIRAKKFTNSMRGHLILSQALTYGIRHLKKLENRKNPFPLKGEHAEPSNRADMEYIKEHLFPLYDIFNTD